MGSTHVPTGAGKPHGLSRKRTLVIVIIASLAMALTISGVTSASESQSNRAALESDATLLAQDLDISIAEAADYLEQQQRFLRGVPDVQLSHPATFAGSWVEWTPSFRGVILFTDGAKSAEAEHAARFAGVDVEFRDGGQRSWTELQEQAETVHADLLREGYSDVTTSVRPAEGRVLADVLQSDRGQADLPPSARASNVTVSLGDRAAPGPDSIYGGARLEKAGSTQLACTAGFTVVKSGQTGVLTAGHCADVLDIKLPSGNEIRMTLKQDYQGYYGDYQWHITSLAEQPQFYSDHGFLRDYQGDIVASQGSYACKFGHKTGRTCDYVYAVWVSKTWTDPNTGYSHTARRMVALNSRRADKGDSGGPWYNGTKGYGIHHGPGTVDGVTRDLYSELRGATSALGVQTLLSN